MSKLTKTQENTMIAELYDLKYQVSQRNAENRIDQKRIDEIQGQLVANYGNNDTIETKQFITEITTRDRAGYTVAAGTTTTFKIHKK